MSIGIQGSKQNDNIRSNDAWNRVRWVWTFLFIVGFGGPLLIVWLDSSTAHHASWMSGVVAMILFWHFVVEFWHSPRVRAATNDRPKDRWIVMYVYIVILLWFTLVYTLPVFFFSLMAIFPMVFWVLEVKSAVPAVAVVVGVLVFLQLGGVEGMRSGNYILMIALYVPFVIAVMLVGMWIDKIIIQSEQRRNLIAELEKTQRELVLAEHSRGILQERQRLAREIHDTLAQGFTSIVMHLEAAEGAMPPLAEDAAKHLNRARQTARYSLGQARRVVADLRPEPLDDCSFDVAFARVAEQWSDSADIPATTKITGDPQPISPQAEVTLLRVMQESLINIQKHAHAKKVTATLSFMEALVVLDVQDDGVGLANSLSDGADSAEPNFSSGYGLVAMRERIEQLNGSLEIESELGQGTTVVAQIPIV